MKLFELALLANPARVRKIKGKSYVAEQKKIIARLF